MNNLVPGLKMDKWSDCNNFDFENWYRNDGHVCLTHVPVDVRCPPGYVLLHQNGVCYKFSNDKLSWNNASQKCKDEDGELASVTKRWIEMFLSENLVGDSYIGASKISKGKDWTWTDGKAWQQYEKKKVLEQSETSEGSNLYAVILDNGGNESGWNVSSNGSEAKNYICQFDPNEGILK